MSLVCTNTESSSFPAGSFHVNGSDGSKFVFRGVAPSGLLSARPFLALLFREEKREGTTSNNRRRERRRRRTLLLSGRFFVRVPSTQSEMMMMMILMRFYEQIFFFYVDFSSFFLSFTTKLRYDPNTFTPNNIIFSSPCLCLGGGGAGLAHASVTTFSSVFLFHCFVPSFFSLSLSFSRCICNMV